MVVQNGLPFEVNAPNAETLASMEEADKGNFPHLGSVEELFDDLEKDGEE
jgi:antitoxin component of RelBE/YafQ-DinJ toxin-antitoxin module